MDLGWRQYCSTSLKIPYFFNLRTGQTLWYLAEVQAVTGCPEPQGEYCESDADVMVE